jgi:hypothetical protein
VDYGLNLEERIALARVVMGIFEEWELEAHWQGALLGLESLKPRELERYRRGTAFPDGPEIIERARHVIGIHQALQRTFPNPRMPSFWLYTRSRQLNGVPMEIMVEEGLAGMNRVWHSLDCTANW